MNPLERYRNLSRRGKIAFWCIAIYAFYAVAAGLVAPSILRSKAESILRETTKRDAAIRSVRFNPFTVALTVEGFHLADSDDGAFVDVARLHANFDPLMSVVKRAPVLKELVLTEPDIRLRIDEQGNLTATTIVPEDDSDAPKDEDREAGGTPSLFVGNARIEKGRFVFVDESHAEPFSYAIEPIEFSLDDFATTARTTAPYHLTATAGESASVRWSGNFALEPLASDGSLAIEGVSAAKIWSYFADHLGFRILDGTVGAKTEYTLRGGETLEFASQNGEASIAGLEISAAGVDDSDISVPDFRVAGISFDLGANSLHIESAASTGGAVTLRLERDGTNNLQTMFAPRSGEPADSAEPAEPAAPAGDESGDPFELSVDSISIGTQSISIEDKTHDVEAGLSLSPVALTVKGFSTKPSTTSDVALDVVVEETGKISAKGTLGLEPLALDATVSAEKLPIPAFAPFVRRAVPLQLTGGSVALGATLAFRGDADNTVSISGARITVDEFATAIEDRPFVSWTNLSIDNAAYDTAPAALAVESVELVAPNVAITIDEQGRMNTDALAGGTDAGEPEATGDEANQQGTGPMKIRLESITVANGSVAVEDRSVDPAFALEISDFDATIAGLDSTSSDPADIKLASAVGDHGAIDASASINPLAPVLDGNVNVSLQGLNLRTVSPYAAGAIGYRIESGSMNGTVDYEIDDDEFDSSNRFEFQDLSVKAAPGNKAALVLPLGVAVALLKDGDGDIAVDLPVAGDLSDPNYSFGKPLRDAFVQLITKTATSPFAILGSVARFAGGDLGSVAFAAGRAKLDTLEAQKVEALAAALQEKPDLALVVRGPVHPEIDRPALARANVERRLREIRFDELKRKGRGPESVDDVVLTDRERREMLVDLYEDTFDESERSVRKSIEADDSGLGGDELDRAVAKRMVARLAENGSVDDDALADLGRRRAEAIEAIVVGFDGLDESSVSVGDVDLEAKASGGNVICALELSAR